MGEFRMGPPPALVSELRREFCLDTFIETGTFEGKTAVWASEIFQQVITIESSEALYITTRGQHAENERIEFICGSSAELLPSLLKDRSSCLFWLDAHWCEGSTAGKDCQCPLLPELDAINDSGVDHHILIDDARFFLSPPAPPNLPEQWPDITTVIDRLMRVPRYVAIVEDVIAAVPLAAKAIVTAYCQRSNSRRIARHLVPIVQDLALVMNEPVKALKAVFQSGPKSHIMLHLVMLFFEEYIPPVIEAFSLTLG